MLRLQFSYLKGMKWARNKFKGPKTYQDEKKDVQPDEAEKETLLKSGEEVKKQSKQDMIRFFPFKGTEEEAKQYANGFGDHDKAPYAQALYYGGDLVGAIQTNLQKIKELQDDPPRAHEKARTTQLDFLNQYADLDQQVRFGCQRSVAGKESANTLSLLYSSKNPQRFILILNSNVNGKLSDITVDVILSRGLVEEGEQKKYSSSMLSPLTLDGLNVLVNRMTGVPNLFDHSSWLSHQIVVNTEVARAHTYMKAQISSKVYSSKDHFLEEGGTLKTNEILIAKVKHPADEICVFYRDQKGHVVRKHLPLDLKKQIIERVGFKEDATLLAGDQSKGEAERELYNKILAFCGFPPAQLMTPNVFPEEKKKNELTTEINIKFLLAGLEDEELANKFKFVFDEIDHALEKLPTFIQYLQYVELASHEPEKFNLHEYDVVFSAMVDEIHRMIEKNDDSAGLFKTVHLERAQLIRDHLLFRRAKKFYDENQAHFLEDLETVFEAENHDNENIVRLSTLVYGLIFSDLEIKKVEEGEGGALFDQKQTEKFDQIRLSYELRKNEMQEMINEIKEEHPLEKERTQSDDPSINAEEMRKLWETERKEEKEYKKKEEIEKKGEKYDSLMNLAEEYRGLITKRIPSLRPMRWIGRQDDDSEFLKNKLSSKWPGFSENEKTKLLDMLLWSCAAEENELSKICIQLFNDQKYERLLDFYGLFCNLRKIGPSELYQLYRSSSEGALKAANDNINIAERAGLSHARREVYRAAQADAHDLLKSKIWMKEDKSRLEQLKSLLDSTDAVEKDPLNLRKHQKLSSEVAQLKDPRFRRIKAAALTFLGLALIVGAIATIAVMGPLSIPALVGSAATYGILGGSLVAPILGLYSMGKGNSLFQRTADVNSKSKKMSDTAHSIKESHRNRLS